MAYSIERSTENRTRRINATRTAVRPAHQQALPGGFDDPMYMIVNLAMGAKYFKGAGLVDAESPVMVEFQIDRISVYQIDR
jgi:hypothetical protein